LGIEARRTYLPLHRLPYFTHNASGFVAELPHTDRIWRSTIDFPSGPNLTEEQVETVARELVKLVKQF